jgi:hypothetical protein
MTNFNAAIQRREYRHYERRTMCIESVSICRAVNDIGN